jgi:hypothetical protein
MGGRTSKIDAALSRFRGSPSKMTGRTSKIPAGEKRFSRGAFGSDVRILLPRRTRRHSVRRNACLSLNVHIRIIDISGLPNEVAGPPTAMLARLLFQYKV